MTFILLAVLFLCLPLQVSADGGAPNVAYVAGTTEGISSIDIAQQKVTNTIILPGDPHTTLLSIDGRVLYATQPNLGDVAVIAAKTKQILCKASVAGHPTLLTLDPGTNTLYTASNDATVVSAIDPNTCAIKYTLKLSTSIYGLAVAVIGTGFAGGNGNELWVATSSSLSVFDTSGKHIATVPMQGQPQYLCIPPGTIVYVTTRQGTVEAVDLSTKRVLPPLLTGGTFGPMDYDAITGEVYVPDTQHDLLDVLTPVTSGATSTHSEPGRVIHLNGSPQSIAITSDGQLGFVALANGKVVMLDIPGRQLINTISVGGSPHFIVTGLYPSLISLTPQQATAISIINNLAHYGAAILIVLVAVFAIFRNRLRFKK
ncbi:MAG: YncE family protein [Ktedonobacteraceae bacterium]